MTNIAALVLATLVLIMIPGPNVALIVANSLRHGLRSGLATAFGTTVGLAIQLLIVVAGMAALIDLAASALTWIRWLGVMYLLYLGITTWREPADTLGDVQALSSQRAFWRGAGFAVINPKTLLFNAAFLPQFVGTGADARFDLMIVAGTFLGVVVVGDAAWALFAASARGWLAQFGHLRNKITSGFLVTAGLGLAISRRSV
ncbi:MAG: LysE family translocator [Woeseiaceae bacterium]